ncbi:hypothetical protein HF668_05525 [Acidithiobacillus ferridurans]|uniref:hypothetical protein n=1 Tax=Acidithiobacillus ferridurans TaxID=1232575 RepID=UPI001C067E62|nr:hypothetical protein [Acidithiobacillus ferridurans]MBU2804608.1 hypothetical protein [Acidithiobacillus ferridurans]
MTAIIVCSDRPRVGRSLLTSIFAESLPSAQVVAVAGSSDGVDRLQAEILTAIDAYSDLSSGLILIDFPVPIDRASDFFVDALHEIGHEVRMAYIVSPDVGSRRLLNSAFGKQADRLVAVINAYMPNAVKSWERSVEAQNWRGTAIWSSPPARVLTVINESHMSFSELWSASGGQHLVDRQAIKWWYERTINNVCKLLL